MAVSNAVGSNVFDILICLGIPWFLQCCSNDCCYPVGFGDMAVSNAVGSNVFDILICLGIPWFLQCTVRQWGKPVQVYSEGIVSLLNFLPLGLCPK